MPLDMTWAMPRVSLRLQARASAAMPTGSGFSMTLVAATPSLRGSPLDLRFAHKAGPLQMGVPTLTTPRFTRMKS